MKAKILLVIVLSIFNFLEAFAQFDGTATTDAETNLTANSATLNGTIADVGSSGYITYIQFEWKLTSGGWPGTLVEGVPLETGDNGTTVTYNLSGLDPGTSYDYRLVVTDDASNIYEANTITFVTDATISLPTLNTLTVSGITSSSAQSGGNTITTGSGTIDDKGVIWGTSTPLDWTTKASYSSAGSGTATFSGTSISGLTANTQYYYTAYAHNEAGYGYGSTGSFYTTAATAPSVTSHTATTISTTTFTSGGNLTSTGGATTERGVVVRIVVGGGTPTYGTNTVKTTDVNDLTTGNFTSNVSGLTAGRIYNYRAYAKNSVTTVYGTGTPGLRLYTAPTASAGTYVSTSSFYANWGTSADATKYYLDVDNNSDFSSPITGYNALDCGTSTSQVVTGLSPNTTYYFRARAYNSTYTIYSAYTSSQSILTGPSAPSLLSTSNTATTSFTATWSAAGGATSYKIDVATDVNFTAMVSGFDNLDVGNNLEKNITGLTAGTLYYFRVRASNGTSSSDNSAAWSTTTYCNAPTATAASNIAGTSFDANWTAPSGGAPSSYLIDVGTTAGGSDILNSQNVGNVLTYNVSGLSAGTTYYYRVRANNAAGNSSYSNTITVYQTPTTQASNVSFSSVGSSSLTTTWTIGSGSSRAVFMKAANTGTASPVNGTTYTASTTFGSGTQIGSSGWYCVYNGTGTSVTVSGLSGSTDYIVMVCDYNGTAGNEKYKTDSGTDNPDFTTTIGAPVTQASNLTASSVLSTQITFSWTSGSGTKRVVFAYQGGSGTPAPVDGTTYTASTTFGSGTEIGTSGWYCVYNNTGSSLTVTGLTANTAYRFMVCEYSGAAGNEIYNSTSATGNPMDKTMAPSAPTATDATNISTTSFYANWDPVSGATSYRLDVNTAADFTGTSILSNQTVVASTYLVSPVTAGTTYYYRVRSYNGETSGNSNNKSATTKCGPPTATTETPVSSTSFTANWTAPSGGSPDHYHLDVSASSIFTSYVTGYQDLQVSGTSQLVSNLTEGTSYYYRVRADNTTGASNNSNVIGVVSTPSGQASLIDTINIASTTVTIVFSPGNGERRLVAIREASLGTFTNPSNGTTYSASTNWSSKGSQLGTSGYYVVSKSASTSIDITGLTPGTTYYVRVCEYNGDDGYQKYLCDESTDNPNDFTTLTTPTTQASSINFSALAPTSFTINWTSGNGSNRIVAVKEGTQGTITNPSSSTTYTASSNWSSKGTQLGTSGYYIVYNGSGSSVSLTNLSANTSYWVQIFEYNGASGGELYLTTTATNNPADTTTNKSAPVTQATNLSFSNITSTSMSVSWTRGNGDKVLVIAKITNPITTNPSNNTTYAAAVASPFGDAVGTANVIYNGTGTTADITGLTAGSTYYFQAFEYNNGAGYEQYLTSTASNNPNSQATALAAPTATNATSITTSSFYANWNAVTGATSYRLDVATDAGFTSFVSGFNNLTVNAPTVTAQVTGLTAGTTYYYRVRAYNGLTSSNSNTITAITYCNAPTIAEFTNFDANWTSFTANWTAPSGGTPDNYYLDVATDVGFTGFVSGYNNLSVNGLSQSVTGLTAGNSYYYRVRAANSTGSSANSSTYGPVQVPGTQAHTLVSSSITTTSMTVGWTRGTGARVIVLAHTSAINTIPSNSSSYTANSIYGSGNQIGSAFVVYDGTGTSVNVTGLSVGTTYHFRAFEYNNASGTEIYNTTSASNNPNAWATLNSAPTVQATNLLFSNISRTSLDLSWTDGNGSNVIVVAHTSAISTDPSDNTTYSASSAYGSGGQVGSAYVIFNGVGTSVSVTGLAANTTYYFRAYEYNNSAGSETYMTASSTGNPASQATWGAVWTGGTSTAWTTVGNWTDSYVPIATDNVKITNGTNEPTISTSVTLNELTVESGAILTIGSGTNPSTGDLTTNGAVTNAGTIFVTAGPAGKSGSLITNHATFTNTGTVQMKVSMSKGSPNKWHCVSSPMSDANISTYSWALPNKFYYDESQATNYWQAAAGTMNVGQGYYVCYNANKYETFSSTAAGGFNNSDVSGISLTNSARDGWNLLGNPYPSSLDWKDADWSLTNISATIYVKNGDNWATYNRTTDATTNSGSQYIQPGQGFFVVASANTSITIPKGARIHNVSGTLLKNSNPLAMIKLNLFDATLTSENILLFSDNATNAFDFDYDAYKLNSDNTNTPELYTTSLNNDTLVVDAMPQYTDELVKPLGIKIMNNGTYTIKAKSISNFADYSDIILEDTETGSFTDLRSDSLYSFTVSNAPINNSTRFNLYFRAPSTPVVVNTNTDNITQTSATYNGNVTSEGTTSVTSKGICWATTENPDLTNNVIETGNGTGTITAEITGLVQGTTYHVRAYATNAVGTTYGDNISFTTIAGNTISGKINYNNAELTALNNVSVNLVKGEAIIATSTTDVNGSYSFDNITDGNYSITATTDIQWGGVSASDVLKLKRQIAGLETFSDPITSSSGDPNNSGFISSADALLVARRIINLDNSFDRSDWNFELPVTGGNNITVNNSQLTHNLYAQCTGDVNGSYNPLSVLRISRPTLNLTSTINHKLGETFEIAVYANKAQSIGALQLNFSYPENLIEIKDVYAGNDNSELLFKAENGLLKVIWASTNYINVNENQPVVKLIVNSLSKGFGEITLENGSELFDTFGYSISDARLSSSFINIDNNSNSVDLDQEIEIYPNPVSDKLHIDLKGQSNINIEIMDIQGKVIFNSLGQQNIGIIDFSKFEAGVYIVKATDNKNVSIRRIVKN